MDDVDDMSDFIDDGDGEQVDVSKYIQEIFGYDRSRLVSFFCLLLHSQKHFVNRNDMFIEKTVCPCLVIFITLVDTIMTSVNIIPYCLIKCAGNEMERKCSPKVKCLDVETYSPTTHNKYMDIDTVELTYADKCHVILQFTGNNNYVLVS